MKPRKSILRFLLQCVAVTGVLLVACVGHVRASPGPMYFNVVADSTGGPPYPSAPALLVKVFDVASPLLADAVPMESISFTFSDGIEDVPMQMTASDSGGAVGAAGTTLNMEVLLTQGDSPPEMMTVFIQFGGLGAGWSHEVDQVTYTENDFDAYFTTHMASGAYLTHHLYGQVGLSGPMTLGTVGFESASTKAFDAYITIDGIEGESQDPGSPMLFIHMNAHYVPEPAALVLLAFGGLALIRRRR